MLAQMPDGVSPLQRNIESINWGLYRWRIIICDAIDKFTKNKPFLSKIVVTGRALKLVSSTLTIIIMVPFRDIYWPILLHIEYRLISKKGEGTFSEVLQAQSIKTNKQVAIKCMKANFYNIEKVSYLPDITVYYWTVG